MKIKDTIKSPLIRVITLLFIITFISLPPTLISHAEPTYTDWTVTAPQTLTANKEVDNLYISGDLDLSAYTLTVHGDVIHGSGTLNINGGTIDITGDYRIQSEEIQEDGTKKYINSNGYLVMTNSGDKVNVGGDFIMQSVNPHSSNLTAGTLSIGGNFKQVYNPELKYGHSVNFRPRGTHNTVFIGEKEHDISFAYESVLTESSLFNNLDISEQIINISTYARIGGGATVKSLNASMNGYLYFSYGAKIEGEFYGNARFTGGFNLSEDMTVNGSLYLENSMMYLYGKNLSVSGDLVVASTGVSLNAWSAVRTGVLSVGGNLTVLPSGSIMMRDEEDIVKVKGDFYYDSNATAFTYGELYIGGNAYFGDINSYSASTDSTNEIIFNGENKQTITFANPIGNTVNIIRFRNTSADGIEITETLNCKTVINENNCKVVYLKDNEKLTESKTIDGDYYLAGKNLDLNGNTLTITGNLIQSDGALKINGGTLNVTGDYLIQTETIGKDGTKTYEKSTGTLIMTNPDGKLNIGGDFVTQSLKIHYGTLTAGEMLIGGNFKQIRGNAYNFYSNGSHKVKFTGEEKHTISFDAERTNDSYSRFNNFDISGQTIETLTNTAVAGKINSANATVIGAIFLTSGAKSEGALNSDVYIYSFSMTEDMTINGDVYIQNLYLSGENPYSKG